MTSKLQGNVGLGQAIAYYTMRKFIVSLPLNDAQGYDLIVDNGALHRVQVKTTRYKDKYSRFVVVLKTSGGNKTGSSVKYFDKLESEFLFILTADGVMYEIPCKELTASANLSLGKKVEKYIVNLGSMV